MVRTAAGVGGPDWGVWGDLGLSIAPHFNTRVGGELGLASSTRPWQLYGLAELAPGTHRVQAIVAGGVVGSLQAGRAEVRPRVELGGRVAIRWGFGVRMVIVSDLQTHGGRLGGYLEW